MSPHNPDEGPSLIGWRVQRWRSSHQRLIFEARPTNVRKVVLTTNMAETSITISDIVFIVDYGKTKETSYDTLNNTPYLLPSLISKAFARKRKGRAGCVQPGECYHLYLIFVYKAFSEYQLPKTSMNTIAVHLFAN